MPATGQFPRGKLNPDDEGELVFQVGHDLKGNVIIDFGKPVTWFAFPHDMAVALAELLIDHAEEARDASVSKT